MKDVFDDTRKKVKQHINTVTLPDVLKDQEPAFKKKAEELILAHLNSPEFIKRINSDIHYQCVNGVMKYFRSKEFKIKCTEVAKGLLK